MQSWHPDPNQENPAPGTLRAQGAEQHVGHKYEERGQQQIADQDVEGSRAQADKNSQNVDAAIFVFALEKSDALYPSSLASIVMFALSTFDTGQPLLAFAAALSNAALSAFGTRAATSRRTAVMVQPESSFSIVSVALV